MIYRFIKKMDTKKKLGKRIISSLITDEKRRKLDKHLKDRERTKMIRRATGAKESCLEDILQTCVQHISPVTAPLALISQIPFSGGSLLSRLLDGHSKLHSYPLVFTIARPDKASWSDIDIDDKPENCFDTIYQTIADTSMRQGFWQKDEYKARFPVMYLPLLQKQIFVKYLESVKPVGQRHIFDAHMTACFGAWLNYQNHAPDKKFVTVYAPGLTTQKDAISNFFELYPEGRLISMIRNPAHWFVSSSGLDPEIFGDAESALSQWQESTRAAMHAREKFGNRVCLIKFEDLVGQTEPVMRFLSDFLGISYENILLKPTFNGIAIRSAERRETDEAPARDTGFMESEKLAEDKRKFIIEMTATDYKTVMRQVALF